MYKEKKKEQPLNALEVTSARVGGACNNACSPLHLHLYEQQQQSEHRTSGSWQLHKLLLEHTQAAWVVGGRGLERWRIYSCYHTMNWNWFELNLNLPWSLSLDIARLQSYRIVTLSGLYQCNCCLGVDTGSWCFLLCHLPRNLSESLLFNCTSLPGKKTLNQPSHTLLVLACNPAVESL